jgi:hypothetical protein
MILAPESPVAADGDPAVALGVMGCWGSTAGGTVRDMMLEGRDDGGARWSA